MTNTKRLCKLSTIGKRKSRRSRRLPNRLNWKKKGDAELPRRPRRRLRNSRDSERKSR
jgi:hypothetical protein